jgi:hypothetical protein
MPVNKSYPVTTMAAFDVPPSTPEVAMCKFTYSLLALLAAFGATISTGYTQAQSPTTFADVAVGFPDHAALQARAASVKDQATFALLLQVGHDTSKRIDAAYAQGAKLQPVTATDCKRLTEQDAANAASLAAKATIIQSTFVQTSKNISDTLESLDVSIKKMPLGQERVVRESELRELGKLQIEFQVLTSRVGVNAQSMNRLAASIQNARKSCKPIQFSLATDPAKGMSGESTIKTEATTPKSTAASPRQAAERQSGSSYLPPARIDLCLLSETTSLWMRIQSADYETEYFRLVRGQVLQKSALADGIGCFDTKHFPSNTCPNETRQSQWKCTS